jgi:carboxypeptidase Taq
MARVYDKFQAKMTKIADLNHTIAVLSWDKEVNLPKGSNRFRSQQIATLSGMVHELFTDKEMGDLLRRLVNMKSLSAKERKNVVVVYEDYKKSTLFSKEFVMKKSMAISTAFQAWEAARSANDFGLYAQPLDELLAIVKEEAKILKHPTHPYNALLHQYEPGLTVEKLDEVFADVKKKLLPIIKKIRKGTKVNNKFLRKKYNAQDQWDFGLHILESMGYDFDHGRQDLSTHPFTISFSPEDVRVTTRVDENDLGNMTWSCIHEGGHALYEQGLNPEDYGLPTGNAISLSIHESQSRLWENNVGRSKAFWTFHYPTLQALFPKNLSKISLDDFYKGINKIKPNLIRTEADELHYHIHVMIRYEIEKEIMEEKIETKDLANVWNKKYKEYLGIKVPDDLNGILQDVHWSHGSIGYFPTYSLGSFYAAQFYTKAKNDLNSLNKNIRKGDTQPLLLWLRENIHQYGRFYEAEELCKKVTGEELKLDYFITYVKKKYSKIYGIKF